MNYCSIYCCSRAFGFNILYISIFYVQNCISCTINTDWPFQNTESVLQVLIVVKSKTVRQKSLHCCRVSQPWKIIRIFQVKYCQHCEMSRSNWQTNQTKNTLPWESGCTARGPVISQPAEDGVYAFTPVPATGQQSCPPVKVVCLDQSSQNEKPLYHLNLRFICTEKWITKHGKMHLNNEHISPLIFTLGTLTLYAKLSREHKYYTAHSSKTNTRGVAKSSLVFLPILFIYFIKFVHHFSPTIWSLMAASNTYT